MGWVADQIDDPLEGGVGVDAGCLKGLELGFEINELAGERGLLLAGDIGGHDAVHGVLGPLVAIALHLVDLPLQGERVAGGVITDGAQVFGEAFADGGQGLGAPDGMLGSPGLFDDLLDALDGQGGHVALAGLGLASGAEVVLVGGAASSGVDAVDHPGPAHAAVDGAAEVVQVLALAVAATAVAIELVLDALERVLGDEGLVVAGVLDAAEGGVAEVIAVGQHPVDVAALQGPLGLLGGGADGQAALGQQLGHPGERHVGVVGVGGEGPADVVGAVVVDLHLAGFGAVNGGADVLVADWGAAQGAAAAHLLLHALDDLLGEVLAVEVGDGGEDAVHELPLRCLVDVFGDRDQPGAGLADGHVDGHIVGSAAGETIDLVHQHDVDGVLPQVGQHLLQLGPVGGAAGLASVGELADDLCSDGVGLGLDRGALSRDGQSLGEATAAGLVLGGDP
nr:hypothetical protein [Nocardioides acrostichi]